MFLYLNKVQLSQALWGAANPVVLIFCFLLKAGTHCCISPPTTYAFPVLTLQSQLPQLLIPGKLPLLILSGIEDVCSQTGSNAVVARMFVKFVLYRFNLRQSNWMEVSATLGHAQMLCLRSPYLCLRILAHVTFRSESTWYLQVEYSKEEEIFHYFSNFLSISDSVKLQKKKKSLCRSKREKSSFSHSLLLCPAACLRGVDLSIHIWQRKADMAERNQQPDPKHVYFTEAAELRWEALLAKKKQGRASQSGGKFTAATVRNLGHQQMCGCAPC